MKKSIDKGESFSKEEKIKIDFLENKFENHKEKVGIEVEIKVFPGYEIKNGLLEKKEKYKKTKLQKGKVKLKKDYLLNVDTNLEETKKLEKKVKKDGKIIFDGEIEYIRYDDKFTKSQGYYLIRVRHLKGKEWDEKNKKLVEVDKYQLTIKKEGKNKAESQEYEETYNSKEEIEKSLEGNGFKAKKRYKKTRKEYSVNFSEKDNQKSDLDLKGKYLKISFDEYKDYTEEEIQKLKKENSIIEIKNYGKLPKFLEIESQDGKKYSLEGIKKYGLEDTAQTTGGPEKILKLEELKKYLINSKIIENKNLVSAILANFISSNKELYKGLTDKEREKYKETFIYIKGLSKLFTVSIKKSLKDLVKKEPKYLEIFDKLIFVPENKKIAKITDKFYEKINRYLNGFEISILNSIKKDLEKKNKKGGRNNRCSFGRYFKK